MSNHRSIASRAYSALGRIAWKVIRRNVKTTTHKTSGKTRSKPAATEPRHTR